MKYEKNMTYLKWTLWADSQIKKGIKQKRCKSCGKWLFPAEKKDHVCKGRKDSE